LFGASIGIERRRVTKQKQQLYNGAPEPPISLSSAKDKVITQIWQRFRQLEGMQHRSQFTDAM
jgi:hypothetical protein